MAKSAHRRLKIGGTKFNDHIKAAVEANAIASDTLAEITRLYRANELTTETLLCLLLLTSTAVSTTHANLFEVYAIIQETAVK